MSDRSVHIEHGATTLNLRQSGHAIKMNLARTQIVALPT